MIGIVVMLISAALIGWIADLVVPGRLPMGLLGAIVAGLVGAWIGGMLLGGWGPQLGGLYLIPGIIGAIIFSFVVRFLLGTASRQSV